MRQLRHWSGGDYVFSPVTDYFSSPSGGQVFNTLPNFELSMNGRDGTWLANNSSANPLNVHWDNCGKQES